MIAEDGIRSTIAMLYVDDTGFEKIVFDSKYSYMFAGPSDLINEWKTWIASPTKLMQPRPAVRDDFAVCFIDSETKIVRFEHGQRIRDDKYRFAGTGAVPAHKCWTANTDPIKAVESAKESDIFSGGTVKYLDISNRTSSSLNEASVAHNLNLNGSFDSIKAATLSKGMVMYTQVNKANLPINEACANDPRIKDFVSKIANGEVVAKAPCGLDTVVWTETDEKRLDDALNDMFSA